MRDFYRVMDSIAARYDSIFGDTLSDHILAKANPWIVDTLAGMQYETMMARDSFVYDQRNLIVFKKGDSLRIPRKVEIETIMKDFSETVLDLNIPEYKMRILVGKDTLYSIKTRVGRNERKHLDMAGTEIWLGTDKGTGKIIRHEKYPLFINPADNHRYYVTRRDDYRTTKTPLIPWIEAELDGQRKGDLIHPTTNPVTLGKPYSNGCVGVSEADAWRVYFNAPLGTKVIFRYDLRVKDEKGDTIKLRDIYGYPPKVIPLPVLPPVPPQDSMRSPDSLDSIPGVKKDS